MQSATKTLNLEELVIEYGPLDRTYGLFVPSTINAGAQILKLTEF